MIKKKDVVKMYESIGLIEHASPRQADNGTYVFYDDVGNCNWMFYLESRPRVEFISDKTKRKTNYALPIFGSSQKEDMIKALPYILRRRERNIRNKAKSLFKIFDKML